MYFIFYNDLLCELHSGEKVFCIQIVAILCILALLEQCIDQSEAILYLHIIKKVIYIHSNLTNFIIFTLFLHSLKIDRFFCTITGYKQTEMHYFKRDTFKHFKC